MRPKLPLTLAKARRDSNTGSNPVGATLASNQRDAGQESPVRAQSREAIAPSPVLDKAFAGEAPHQHRLQHLPRLWNALAQERADVRGTSPEQLRQPRGVE
jgi:hypothetical protein